MLILIPTITGQSRSKEWEKVYYFKKIENGIITSVESKSVNVASPFFIEATQAEYDDFIASLPPPEPPEPVRDLAAEIDEIKARMEILGEK